MADIAERVKADSAPEEVEAIRRDIARFLLTTHDDLDQALAREFVNCYRPGGDGLTMRDWLRQIDDRLRAPPDTSRDHRSVRGQAGLRPSSRRLIAERVGLRRPLRWGRRIFTASP